MRPSTDIPQPAADRASPIPSGETILVDFTTFFGISATSGPFGAFVYRYLAESETFGGHLGFGVGEFVMAGDLLTAGDVAALIVFNQQSYSLFRLQTTLFWGHMFRMCVAARLIDLIFFVILIRSLFLLLLKYFKTTEVRFHYFFVFTHLILFK